MALVEAVLEYRAAGDAVEAFNEPDKARGFEKLSGQPHLLDVLARMHRAQVGLDLETGAETLQAEGMAIAEEYRSEG